MEDKRNPSLASSFLDDESFTDIDSSLDKEIKRLAPIIAERGYEEYAKRLHMLIDNATPIARRKHNSTERTSTFTPGLPPYKNGLNSSVYIPERPSIPINVSFSSGLTVKFEFFGNESVYFSSNTPASNRILLFESNNVRIALPIDRIELFPSSLFFYNVKHNIDYKDGVFHIVDDPNSSYVRDVAYYVSYSHLMSFPEEQAQVLTLIKEFYFFKVPLPKELEKVIWKHRRHHLYKYYQSNFPIYCRVRETVYYLTKDMIVKYHNEEFIEYLLRNPNQEVDEYYHIRIANNCYWHRYLFLYLQYGKFFIEDSNLRYIGDIRQEFLHFHIHLSPSDYGYYGYLKDPPLIPKNVPNSSLLMSLSDSELQLFASWLKDKYNWERVFKYTPRDLDMLEFHNKVDNLQDLLYIVRLKCGYILGGYTKMGYQVSHCASGYYLKDSSSFLFSLKNATGKVFRFDCCTKQQALYCYTDLNYIVSFGMHEFSIKKHNQRSLIGMFQLDKNQTYFQTIPEGTQENENYNPLLIGYENLMPNGQFIIDELEIFHGIPYS